MRITNAHMRREGDRLIKELKAETDKPENIGLSEDQVLARNPFLAGQVHLFNLLSLSVMAGEKVK